MKKALLLVLLFSLTAEAQFKTKRFWVKLGIVAGSVGLASLGAYRDTQSTKLSLAAGNYEIGYPYRAANTFTGAVSGACVSAMFFKRIDEVQTAVMCSAALTSGVARNLAATHNYELVELPKGRTAAWTTRLR